MKVVYQYISNYYGSPAVVLIWQYNQWRPSSLQAKGLSEKKTIDIGSRTMTEEDLKDLHPYRLSITIYRDWESLINDEHKCNVDEDFIKKLIEFSITHPLKAQKELQFESDQV